MIYFESVVESLADLPEKSISGMAAGYNTLGLIDACIIGASAVSLATAYAIGDILSLRHSLHRKVQDAKAFYGVFSRSSARTEIPIAPTALQAQTVAVPDNQRLGHQFRIDVANRSPCSRPHSLLRVGKRRNYKTIDPPEKVILWDALSTRSSQNRLA